MFPGPTKVDITAPVALFKAKCFVGFIVQVVELISPERLRTFERHTDTQARAIALHNHTLQLGASLMSLIALLELALRNSTNQRLIDDFGDDQWLLPGHSAVPLKPRELETIADATSYARRAAQSKLNDRLRATGQHVPRRPPPVAVSHGQILSQTTFAFWRRLYSDEYEATLWKRSIKRVFPDKSLQRADLSKALAAIHEARNRAAHHEPIYGDKLDQAMDALEFIRSQLGARTATEETAFKHFTRIQHLRVRMDYESYREAWQTLTLPQP